MESDRQNTAPEPGAQGALPEPAETPAPFSSPQPSQPWETRAVLWLCWGPNGLRAGWSIVAFLMILATLASLVSIVFLKFHLIDLKSHFNAPSVLAQELVMLLPAIGAAAVMALIERRRGNLLAYNLLGPRRTMHFLGGVVAGFVALSALVGALYAGHWLQFGASALSGAAVMKYALLWGLAFLAVAGFEEGTFRCYFQFTLTRGINFWWALGAIGLVCLDLVLRGKGNGIWGVYIMAAAGLLPCAWLHFSKVERGGFWQAAWVTSTVFGFIHTGNTGENWIGIFAAGAIGFVFCVSVYMTGSAWWALGCHAAWDWAETFFYGTPDSGMVGTGHLFSTTPVGNALWSGGTDGPEGSALVLPIIFLLLLAVILLYRKSRGAANPATAKAEELPG